MKKRILLFLITHFITSLSFASHLSLKLVDENLSLNQKQKVKELIKEATIMLPPVFFEKIKGQVKVRFKQLDSNPEITPPKCHDQSASSKKTHLQNRIQKNLNARLYGISDTSRKLIYLHSGFLKQIEKGPDLSDSYPCGHETLYELALATLIHELAHFYDQSGDQPGGRMSARKSYRKLVGWRRQNLPFKVTFKPTLLYRNPDPYELVSIQEHFAVNMEFFLLDPQYKCRRPLEYDYYKRKLRFDPYPEITTCTNTRVPLHFLNRSLKKDRIADLDPKRIYEIHYLLASNGKNSRSQWGHSMFRLVVCAPHRKEPSIECLKDVSHHLVISYRAEIDRSHFSHLKTLTGGYPTKPYLYRFKDIVEEYTQSQARDIYHYPIHLSESEKQDLILKFLEEYWQYESKYLIISNNCAHELLRLIKFAKAGTRFRLLSIVSPMSLRDYLLDMRLISDLGLNSATEIEKRRYYYPSALQGAERAFLELSEFALLLPRTFNFPWRTLKEYLTESTPEQRMLSHQTLHQKLFSSLTRDQLSAKQKEQSQTIRRNFTLLEGMIFRLYQKELSKKAFQHLEERGLQKDQNSEQRIPEQVLYEQIVQDSKMSTQIQLFKSGYGIPTQEELEAANFDSGRKEDIQESNRNEGISTSNWISREFGPEILQLQKIQENIRGGLF